MDRYPAFVKYLAVFLIAAHMLAGGHLLCALCYSAHVIGYAKHDYGCSRCLPPEVPPPVHCYSDNCEGHPCDTGELPAVIVQRNNDESANLSSVFSLVCDSGVFTQYQPSPSSFRDTPAFNSSALVLRLHLLYGVLVI